MIESRDRAGTKGNLREHYLHEEDVWLSIYEMESRDDCYVKADTMANRIRVSNASSFGKSLLEVIQQKKCTGGKGPVHVIKVEPISRELEQQMWIHNLWKPGSLCDEYSILQGKSYD